jgi:hypothetical protein
MKPYAKARIAPKAKNGVRVKLSGGRSLTMFRCADMSFQVLGKSPGRSAKMRLSEEATEYIMSFIIATRDYSRPAPFVDVFPVKKAGAA